MREPAIAVGSLGAAWFRRLPSVIWLAFLGVVLSHGTVAAHGGEGPGIEVLPNRAAAGDTVWIYGEELEPLALVRVDLLTAAGEEHIIQVDADEEGHVIDSLTVPADLVPRIYELRATDGAGTVVSTYLTVVDDPDAVGGGPSAAPSVWVLGLGGLVAMAGGVLLVAMMRRSRRRSRAR